MELEGTVSCASFVAGIRSVRGVVAGPLPAENFAELPLPFQRQPRRRCQVAVVAKVVNSVGEQRSRPNSEPIEHCTERRPVRPLRIAITADPEIVVPPVLYGGIERIVDMLVRGLVQRGHAVTLFANPGSQVSCNLLPYPRLRSQSKIDTLANMWHVSQAIQRDHFDLVHSFARLAYLTPLLPRHIPKIMSYQRGVSPRSVRLGNVLSRGTLSVTGCSAHLIRRWQSNGHFHVVYNGVPLETYQWTARVEPDAPLVYLGRVEEIKGVHLAIEVARKSGCRLIIAGNVPGAEHHRRYFAEQIQPHVDGKTVEYVGAVDDAAKNQLLGRSAALLRSEE